jgi:hypothetical protein
VADLNSLLARRVGMSNSEAKAFASISIGLPW